MSKDDQKLIPSPWNQILGQKHAMLKRAARWALGTTCDPSTGEPKPPTALQLRRQLRTIQIAAVNVGDNTIIPQSPGAKLIYEFVLWNGVGQQTIIVQQNATGSGQAITLVKLTDFPAAGGLTLGFNGSFEMPHWEIDSNTPLVVNLAGGNAVDGFVRYKVQNGSY